MSDQSETPETEGFLQTNPLAFDRAINFARSLERRLSLAQTEIKGHMRVGEELKARIAELEKDAERIEAILAIWEAVDSYDRVCNLLDTALKDRA